MGSPMVVTLGQQQYNFGERPTVILYTYINRHIYQAAAWCPYMVINVSVQCNSGLLPDIILLTLCDSIGEPF